MQKFAANGLWAVFDYQPKGVMLWSVWVIEAAFIVLCAVAVSVNEKLTYCEDCRRWTKREEGVAHMPVIDPDELRSELEAENYALLDELRSQPRDMTNRLDIATATCRNCTETSFLTVSHVQIVDDGNGGTTENSTPLILNLVVPREVTDQMSRPVAFGGSSSDVEDDDVANDEEPVDYDDA